jgi:hypothetical protein
MLLNYNTHEVLTSHFKSSIHTILSSLHLWTFRGYLLSRTRRQVKVRFKVTSRLTVNQSVSFGIEPNLGLMTRDLLLYDSYGLVLWGALSDERKDLSFVYAAGTHQRIFSRVRVPWHSWPYFTVSDLRLPFSSPPTTRRVTVEVFDPASTRVSPTTPTANSYKPLIWNAGKRFNCCVTADAVTWPFPTLAFSKCLLLRGSARHGENTASSIVANSRVRVSMLQFLHGVNKPQYISMLFHYRRSH